MYTTKRQCPICKQLIYGSSLYKAKTKKFCSWECFRKNNVATHRIEKSCECGRKIIGRPCRLKKYCSKECFHKNYRHNELIRQKISDNCKGKMRHSDKWKEEARKRMTGNKFALGHKLTKEHIQAIINAQTGEKSHFYKDGRADSKEYINWQKNEWHRRKRNAVGHHTYEEWQNVKKEYGYKCVHCLQQIKLTEDHIIPLSKGGKNSIDNIQPLCLKCNMIKHNKLPVKSK